jgi:hypothetical protein
MFPLRKLSSPKSVIIRSLSIFKGNIEIEMLKEFILVEVILQFYHIFLTSITIMPYDKQTRDLEKSIRL